MRLLLSLGLLIVVGGLSASTLQTQLALLDNLRATAVEYGGVQATAKAEFDATSSNTILFVGDVMLARNVERVIQQYGDGYPFAAFDWPVADYVFANYEGATPAVHRTTPNNGMSFSISTTSAISLVYTPITHLSLANNHSYDQGEAGFIHTKAFLSSLGFVPFGDQVLSDNDITYIELDGNIVSVLGLYALYNDVDMDELAARLAIMRETSDIQIAYVHWGNEYELTHSSAQQALASFLSDGGVDMVVGHHPHVVQDIAFVGDTLVAYSLGNFLFDQYFDETVEEGLMIGLTIEGGQMVVDLYGITSEGSRSQPQRMSAYDNDIFLREVATRSQINIRKAVEAGRITMPLPTLSNE